MNTLENFMQKFDKVHSLTYAEVREWFTPKREARFWNKVNKNAPNGCWVWTGALWDFGYGRYDIGRKGQRVHRLTFMLERGRDIPDCFDNGQPAVVRHLMCDNPPCCNPAHLVLGTRRENKYDQALMAEAYEMDKQQKATAEYLSRPFAGYFHDRGDRLGTRHASMLICVPSPLLEGTEHMIATGTH